MTTLYERWLEVVREHRHECALFDVASDRRWTFSQLAAEVELDPAEPGPVTFPQGSGANFPIQVLRAWRTGRLVCPLEPGQPRPLGPWPAPPIVHLKTTSATTGHPRLIALTAPQLAADADHIVATMGLRPDWPNLGVISLAHSYGFSNLISPLLLHGIPLVLVGSTLPEALRRAARTSHALTLPAVPALWRAWHDAHAIPDNVRLAISAGAPLPAALERTVFHDTGIKLHNFYGASECGGIAFDRTQTPRIDDTCAGSPLQGVSLQIGDTGCLDIRAPSVASTYWPTPSPTLDNCVYRTADLAELRNGEVFLLGRASDLINVAGRKVVPETIERALLEHPAVRETLVLGLPAADGREETIAAVVVARQPVLESDLRQFLLERLPAWQVPRRWCFHESSLANSRGKTARSHWRLQLEPTPRDPTPPDQPVGQG